MWALTWQACMTWLEKNAHLRTNIFLECKQLFKKKGQGGDHFHILSAPLHKHAINMESSWSFYGPVNDNNGDRWRCLCRYRMQYLYQTYKNLLKGNFQIYRNKYSINNIVIIKLNLPIQNLLYITTYVLWMERQFMKIIITVFKKQKSTINAIRRDLWVRTVRWSNE